MTDFTGNADAYTGTFSCWFRRDSAGTTDTFIGSEGNTVRIRIQAANTLNFSFIGPAAETFQFTSTGTYLSSPLWRWIGASWNLNAIAGAKVIHIYDDAGVIAGSKTDASAAFMVDYTRTSHAVASAVPVGSTFNGCLSELFFAPGQFIDLSVLANREKFIIAGKPVSLGADGSTPLGSTPLVYLKNPAPTAGVNSGSGGDFTIMGSPAVASNGPSDRSLIQQYLDRMTTPPSAPVQTAITNFLNGLWTDGVYQKLDAAWLMNLHTEQASRLNIINSNHTLTNVGAAPTWVSGVGGAGGFTAAGAQLSTGFGVSTHGRNMVQDSAHLSLRSWTSAGSTISDVGIGLIFLNPRTTGDQIVGRCFGAANDTEANTDGAGLFALDRSDPATFKFYKTGLPQTVENEVSVSTTATELYVLGVNAGSVSTRRQSFVSFGGSLGDAGHAALNTRLLAFEAAIGAT